MTDRSSRSGRDDAALHSPLPVGTRIREYVIERVLGNGGFGITYLARHSTIGRQVAIKEHFPREFAYRTGITIRPSSHDDEVFDWARRKFLDEARVLARFEHPAIVKVLDVFEENGTAYMVQGFEAGESLGSWRTSLDRAPTQEELDDIVFPLLDALETVHDDGLLHRDIAPDNIIIRRDGKPCLIDFGAARGFLGERTRTIAVVKPGYSPPEQYANDARLQGPWTDIYALAATLYHTVTGDAPQVATLRGLDDDNEMAPATAAARGDYRPEMLEAIDAAMAIRPAKRPQSVAEWRRMLEQGAGRGEPVRLTSQPRRSEPRRSGPHGSETREADPSGDRASSSGRASSGRASSGRLPARPAHAGAAPGDDADRVATTPAFPWHLFVLGAIAFIVLALIGHWLLSNANRLSATECDRLAASPTDPSRGAPGVEWQDMDGEATVRACTQDVTRIADVFRPRLQVQLGRGHERLKQFADAARNYRAAATAGNAEGMSRLGDLLYGAQGVARDLAEACRLYEAAANAGHAEAMTSWGACLERGLGATRRDRARAIEWYRRASARGFVDADISLATGFAGEAIGRSSAEAVRLLTNASRRGSWEATYWLAERYDSGDGVAPDTARARQLYGEAAGIARRVAAANRGNGHFILALMLYNGHGIELDRAAAARHFREAADLGQHYALSWLGSLYERGEGVAIDLAEARRLYEAAVERNDNDALPNLAALYRDGKGVTKDPARARALLERALALDVTSAMHDLAYLNEEGIGGPVDYGEAMRLYRLAADRGSWVSLNSIGQMHENGRGVPADAAEAARWYMRGAERGEPAALESLAALYQEGKGVARSDAEALKLLTRAAERGYASAMTRLGQAVRDGRGVEKSPALALEWFRKAAARGDGEAMNLLGLAYDLGQGVAPDPAAAARWYRGAIDKGDANAIDNLGTLFEEGRGVAKSPAEALRHYRLAAERGVTSAMVRLGTAYREGRLGLARSTTTAIDWYKKAAEKGDGDASVVLGTIYEGGNGVPADAAAAARWYERGIEAGSGEASAHLGLLRLAGKGVAQDQALGVELLRTAAQKGVAFAMYELGKLYRQGTGVIKSFAEARRWLAAAVDKGDFNAMNLLGVMMAEGEGGAADPTAAAKLFQLAAEKGQDTSMYNLATLLENGRGVAKSCRDAQAWYQKAAAAGHADAKKKIADGSLARCR